MNSKWMKACSVIIILCGSIFIHQNLFGQNQPEWWYGGSVGVNFNYYGGQVQALNASTTSLAPFTRGAGAGLYLGGLIEYRPDPVWGGMLQLGYDGRRGSFDEVGSGGNTASLSTSLSYLSLEP